MVGVVTAMFDLRAATTRLGALVGNVSDEQLTAPTPCPDYTLGDLLDHVGGLAVAFTHAATKQPLPGGAQGAAGDAARLGADWRTRLPAALDDLAAAWRQPDAWSGMTQAGGVDLPGEVAGSVALDEVVVHGWDVAMASGQPFDVDQELLGHVHDFVCEFSGPGMDEQRQGLFGPEVEVADDAPLLDRVIGMTGRDPRWSPPR